MGSSFLVPFARSAHGALVPPEEARKNERYTCPQCTSAVDLHAGERKRRHFHHRSGGACGPESVTHKIAKALVVQAVGAWRAEGHAAPAVVRRCAAEGCGRSCRQAMPAKVAGAAEEVRLSSGRIVDVALLGAGSVPIAAVEVRASHEVDSAKAGEMLVPWIEVEARQVCESGGRLLEPTQDRFLPWLCAEHAPARREHARRQREEPIRRTALVRRLPFRMEDYPGVRIERLVTCSRGHDAFVFGWAGSDPPWPRPPLVEAREADGDWMYSRVDRRMRKLLPWRRRYVSVCPECGEVVGEDP